MSSGSRARLRSDAARRTAAAFEALRCPSCHGSLATAKDRSARCDSCDSRYPAVASVPLLVADSAADALARGGAAISRARAMLAQTVDELGNETWHPAAREELRERIVGASLTNLRLLEALAELLPNVPSPPGEPTMYETVEQILAYAIRDWSWDPEDERQIRTIESALADALRDVDSELAVVAGAGASRIAHDLTGAFETVVAAELSLPMALVYPLLERAPRDCFAIHLRNARTRSSQVRPFRLSVRHDAHGPFGAPRSDRLVPVVADAKRLPLAAGQASAFFSVYFSDVVPLAELLPEVKRVLRPGGAFVHFGPLGYHFDAPEHHLSAEDVREVFESSGFEIMVDRFVSMVQLDGPAGLRRDLTSTTVSNWIFCARRKAVDLSDRTVVRIRTGASCETKATYEDGAAHMRTVVLRGRGGAELAGHPDLLEVVELVDGARTCAEIEESLGLASAGARSSPVRRLFEKLLELDFLETRDAERRAQGPKRSKRLYK